MAFGAVELGLAHRGERVALAMAAALVGVVTDLAVVGGVEAFVFIRHAGTQAEHGPLEGRYRRSL